MVKVTTKTDFIITVPIAIDRIDVENLAREYRSMDDFIQAYCDLHNPEGWTYNIYRIPDFIDELNNQEIDIDEVWVVNLTIWV